jgi:hypothetical protein
MHPGSSQWDHRRVGFVGIPLIRGGFFPSTDFALLTASAKPFANQDNSAGKYGLILTLTVSSGDAPNAEKHGLTVLSHEVTGISLQLVMRIPSKCGWKESSRADSMALRLVELSLANRCFTVSPTLQRSHYGIS